jgi:hypothetical protein
VYKQIFSGTEETGVYSPGLRWLEHKADDPPPSSDEVMIEDPYLSTPPRTFVPCPETVVPQFTRTI